MSERKGTFRSIALAGQSGLTETFRYYSQSGKEERRIVGASFFMGVTSGVIWFLLALYWDALGFSSEEIGLMGGIGSVAGIASLLFSGFLADKFGRKRLILLGLTGDAVALSMLLTEPNLIVFTAAYGILNTSSSLFQPSLIALMASKTSSIRLKFFFGVQNFSNQIGVTAATALGIFFPGFMQDTYGLDLADGYWYVFLVAAGCAIAPVTYILTVSETKRPIQKLRLKFDKKLQNVTIVYSAQNAILGFGAALVIPWLPLVIQDGMGATSNELMVIITVSNIALAFGWFMVPKFAEARGSVLLIATCQIASVAFLLGIPFAHFSLLLVGALYLARNLLMLVPTPVLNAYIMNVVAEEVRASFYAITSLAWTLAFSAAYALSGYIWANDYSKSEPFILCAIFYVVASLVFYIYFRRVAEVGDGGQAGPS